MFDIWPRQCWFGPSRTVFYEWQLESSVREPWLIARRDGGLMAFAGLWERWWVLEGAALPGSLARTAPGRCRRDLPHPHHRGQRHHARAASPDAGDLVAEGVYDLACRRGCQARTGAGGRARDASSQSTTLATTTRSVWPRLRSGRILRQGTTGMRGGLKRGASGMLAAGVARLQCTHQPTCENARENNRLEELRQPTNPGSRPTSRLDAIELPLRGCRWDSHG